MKAVLLALTTCCLCAHPVQEQATVSLYQLAHKAPADARRLVNKGVTELKHGRSESSLDLFTKALKVDPDEESFQKAIDIDPENPVGYSNLGVAARRLLE